MQAQIVALGGDHTTLGTLMFTGTVAAAVMAVGIPVLAARRRRNRDRDNGPPGA